MMIEVDFWHWWIFAVLLATVEILVPSFFALWMAIAAFITGLALLFMPNLAWEYQVFMFAILTLFSIVMWRRYYLKNPIATDEPLLNRRGEQYIGRVVTLQAPIVDGHGKVKLDDSSWKVEGPDCEAGTRVKLIRLDNVVFTVEIAD